MGYSEADYEKWAAAAKPVRTRSRGSFAPTELEPIQDKTDMDLSQKDPAAEDTRSRFVMTTPQGAGQSSSVTDVAAQAAMMSGNPYAMGAGLGLQTFSNIQKGKQQEKQAAYQNKVNALNNLSNWARGIRSL